MKVHLIYILIFVGVLGITLATRSPPTTDPAQSIELKKLQSQVESLKKENSELKQGMRSETAHSPQTTRTTANPEVTDLVASDATPVLEVGGNVAKKTQLENRQNRVNVWRQRHAQSFDQQAERLRDEKDPAMRKRMIQQMGL